MKPETRSGKEIDPSHQQKRKVLRLIGPLLLATGGVFMIVAFVDFARAMGSFGGPPKLFWCFFIGMPLLWLGFVLSSAGFAGAAQRYMAGETAPVAKDTVNYLADGTKESVKTLATAAGEGFASGTGLAKAVLVRCHKCNETNEANAKFCKSCGAALAKMKPCPSCNELNDPDARFCDHCGKPLSA
jgi:hypothetical protein